MYGDSLFSFPISTSQTVPSATPSSVESQAPIETLRSRLLQLNLRNCHNRISVLFLTDVGSVFVSAVMVGVVLIYAHRVFRVPEDLLTEGFETNTPISWIISSFKEDARFGATTQSILSHESPESHSLWRQFAVIGIAQFSGNLYEFCCKDADDDGKTVIIAVIDGDYLRNSFGDVLEFLPITDSVTKLTVRCEVCGHKGFFTVRRTCDTITELIGGTDARTDTCVETVAAMF
ncbi:hypothetical protein Bca101_017565 [Brassica carinata]